MLKKLSVAGLVAVTASASIVLASPAGAGLVSGLNTGPNSNGNGGVVSDNTLIIPVSIPVILCGDSIALTGRGQSGCRGSASVGVARHHHPWDR